ncbi:unnamed protein product, partial [Hymenolepis diminuta]
MPQQLSFPPSTSACGACYFNQRNKRPKPYSTTSFTTTMTTITTTTSSTTTSNAPSPTPYPTTYFPTEVPTIASICTDSSGLGFTSDLISNVMKISEK